MLHFVLLAGINAAGCIRKRNLVAREELVTPA